MKLVNDCHTAFYSTHKEASINVGEVTPYALNLGLSMKGMNGIDEQHESVGATSTLLDSFFHLNSTLFQNLTFSTRKLYICETCNKQGFTCSSSICNHQNTIYSKNPDHVQKWKNSLYRPCSKTKEQFEKAFQDMTASTYKTFVQKHISAYINIPLQEFVDAIVSIEEEKSHKMAKEMEYVDEAGKQCTRNIDYNQRRDKWLEEYGFQCACFEEYETAVYKETTVICDLKDTLIIEITTNQVIYCGFKNDKEAKDAGTNTLFPKIWPKDVDEKVHIEYYTDSESVQQEHRYVKQEKKEMILHCIILRQSNHDPHNGHYTADNIIDY